MKSIILILAILAIAQGCGMSAIGLVVLPIDPKGAYEAFAQKLKIPAEVNVLGKKCFDSVLNTLANSTWCPPKKTLEENLIWFADQSSSGKMKFLHEVEKQVVAPLMPTCGRYVHALKVHFAQTGLIKDGDFLGRQVRSNFIKHHAVIISELIRSGELALYKESKTFGRTLAYVLEILAGKTTPKSAVFTPVRTVEPKNWSVFTQQLINSFLKEAGIKAEVTLERAKSFNSAFYGFVTKVVYSRATLFLTPGAPRRNPVFAFIEAVAATLKFRTEVLALERLIPHQHHSRYTYGTMVYQVAKNLVTLEFDLNQFQVLLTTNQPVKAGKTLAKILKTVTPVVRRH